MAGAAAHRRSLRGPCPPPGPSVGPTQLLVERLLSTPRQQAGADSAGELVSLRERASGGYSLSYINEQGRARSSSTRLPSCEGD
jgi:hypothetical protein